MPGENLQDWSTTAANNSNADSSIGWAEGQTRASVNDSARSMMAAHAKQRDLLNGSIVTGNTANAQTFFSGLTYTTVPTGLRVMLKIGPGLTNTATATLNMDNIGAVGIKTMYATDLRSGELVADSYAEFVYNGTNWILLARRAGLQVISTQTVSAVTSVDFTGIDNSYDEYQFHFSNVVPATDAVNLQMIISTAAGFQANPTDYRWTINQLANGTNIPSESQADLWVPLTTIQSNNAAVPANGRLILCNPAASYFKIMRWETALFNNNTAFLKLLTGTGFYVTAGTAITGVRFLMSSGNIASGTFSIFGIAR